MTEEQREIRRKKRVIGYAERNGNIKTACRRFGIARSTFYLWPLAGSVPRVGRRAVHTHRYEKQVPGHHVQVDVKFLTLTRKRGGPVRRYPYTAIDDAMRVRALKIYKRHTQKSAIDFIDYVVEKFPFRIQTIRTDRGHEFQALFHWHVADLGMEHTSTSNRGLLSSMERSSALIGPTRTSSTSPSPTRMMWIWRRSWRSGSASTTTTGRTAHTKERHRTRC